MKKITLLFLICIFSFSLFAEEEINDTTSFDSTFAAEVLKNYYDSIDNSFTFQNGEIDLENGLATLTVPSGFKYLDAEQSNTVLTEIWGNPPEATLGLLFPENSPVIGEGFTYAVEITYSDEGYIEDEDAEDIDYDDLLEEMKNDTKEASEYRVQEGYQSIELIGWASPPFYDKEKKKLHWAKEIKFGESDENTLNYNIRVLGRKGYLNLNAIGDMDALSFVQNDVDVIISSVDFKEGNTYFDFDPDIDDIAAYGIGGLIAGKVLAKAGFFVAILKFWKVIAAGAIGLFTLFKKKIFGDKN